MHLIGVTCKFELWKQRRNKSVLEVRCSCSSLMCSKVTDVFTGSASARWGANYNVDYCLLQFVLTAIGSEGFLGVNLMKTFRAFSRNSGLTSVGLVSNDEWTSLQLSCSFVAAHLAALKTEQKVLWETSLTSVYSRHSKVEGRVKTKQQHRRG